MLFGWAVVVVVVVVIFESTLDVAPCSGLAGWHGNLSDQKARNTKEKPAFVGFGTLSLSLSTREGRDYFLSIGETVV
jgi:hypothetical protein